MSILLYWWIMRRDALKAIDVVTHGVPVILLALGGSHLAHAQVYKWVDEKGVTQYSASPPPAGKGQTIIRTPATAPGAAARPAGKTQTWQEKEAGFRERRAAAAERQHKDEVERAAAQRRAGWQRESCIGARRDLQALQEQRPVFSLDERGERKYLDDKDRPRVIEDTKKFIARDCPQ